MPWWSSSGHSMEMAACIRVCVYVSFQYHSVDVNFLKMFDLLRDFYYSDYYLVKWGRHEPACRGRAVNTCEWCHKLYYILSFKSKPWAHIFLAAHLSQQSASVTSNTPKEAAAAAAIHRTAQPIEQGNSEDVDSATVFVVCSMYSTCGRSLCPWVCYSIQRLTFERRNRIRECTF